MYDRIDRCYLWQKLLNENVSSRMITAIHSMYNCVRSCIRYKGSKSSFINSKNGVKQGDPSSSLLCLFFLNDIIQHINTNIDGIMTLNDIKIFLLFFADDAVLFAQNPRSLQSMLSDVEAYCVHWGLTLNVSKTKCMIFEQGRPTKYNFYIYNTKIELVESFKYLGVHLFKNNKWNRTQQRIASHASSALHND